MMIRFLTVVIGIVIAANVPAGADTLILHPVLKTYQPMRIAVPDFSTRGASEAGPAHEIAQIIVSDLKQTDTFAPLDPYAFADKTANLDEIPRFADWRAFNAQGLVVGYVTNQPDARIKVMFRFWDIFGGKQLAGQQYIGTREDVPRMGYMISGDIYERITGEKRTFN